MILYRPDGTKEEIYKIGNPIEMDVQDAVGGWYETVQVSGGILCVNGEGKRLDLPLNQKAEDLTGMPIVGNALFVGNDEGARSIT